MGITGKSFGDTGFMPRVRVPREWGYGGSRGSYRQARTKSKPGEMRVKQ